MIDAAAVLAQADRDAPISWCPTCAQDTLPVKGVCLWCSTHVVTGLLDALSVESDKRARERARWRVNSAARRARRK